MLRVFNIHLEWRPWTLFFNPSSWAWRLPYGKIDNCFFVLYFKQILYVLVAKSMRIILFIVIFPECLCSQFITFRMCFSVRNVVFLQMRTTNFTKRNCNSNPRNIGSNCWYSIGKHFHFQVPSQDMAVKSHSLMLCGPLQSMSPWDLWLSKLQR